MNEADILKNAVSVKEYSLRQLQQWLDYGKHTWSLGAGIIWFPFGIVFTILKIIAVVFTPYMLWHLFKAAWYKSIVVFLLIVILPFVVSKFLILQNDVLNYICAVLPILTFYIFTYIISYMIGEELNKINTLRRWKREERKK